MTFEQFYKKVLKELGYSDWRVDWTAPPSECHNDLKLIIMSNSYKDDLDIYKAEIFLHEVAHIGNPTHNADFWKRYGYLLDRFADEIASME